jgi:hypothetical protein
MKIKIIEASLSFKVNTKFENKCGCEAIHPANGLKLCLNYTRTTKSLRRS